MPCFLFPKMFCEKVENKRRFSTSFCLYAFVSLLCVDLFGLAHLTFTIHKDANQPLLGTREVRSLFHTDTLTHTHTQSRYRYTQIFYGVVVFFFAYQNAFTRICTRILLFSQHLYNSVVLWVCDWAWAGTKFERVLQILCFQHTAYTCFFSFTRIGFRVYFWVLDFFFFSQEKPC